MMDGIRCAVSFEDGGPERFHAGTPPRSIGIAVETVESVESGLDLVPIAGFDRIEESFHFVRHLDFGAACQSVDDIAARTGELREFASDDFLRRARRVGI